MAADADRLWLETLGRLADAIAHEIRNPLNGAMVNLQVVRQRAGRGVGDPSLLVRFADSAVAELARVADLADAILTLARPMRPPIDLWEALRPFGVLYGSLARRAGGSLELHRLDDRPARSDVPSVAMRLALATALEGATRTPGIVRCTLRDDVGSVSVRLEGSLHEGACPDGVRAAIADHGIVCGDTAGAVTISFPRLGETRPL